MTALRSFLTLAAAFVLGVAVGVGAVCAAYHERALSAVEAKDSVPRRWEATVYLPLVDNQDRRIPDQRWQEALARFVEEFGGATLAAEVEGWWRDDHGQLRREPVRPIVVSFEHGRLNDLRRVLAEAGQLLGQQEMYARFEEPRILLLPIAAKSSPKEP